MINGRRNQPDAAFFITWILTFIVLYGLSYAWHGWLLNDLSRISYPNSTFLLLAAGIYFVIAFGITFLVKYLSIISSSTLRGGVIGGIFGAGIYMIAFVFGISFYANPELKYILFDLTWQVFEEGVAGLLCGWLYVAISQLNGTYSKA